MLYNTMKSDFIFQLFIFGSLALLFALSAVYNTYKHHRLIHKKLLSLIFSLICADFTVMFIRVTAPYKALSDMLFNINITLTFIAIIVFIVFIVFYLKEKTDNIKSLGFDILKYIDDYVLIFDQNGEIVLSTCSEKLENKISFTLEETTYEIENYGEYYIASLSPIFKNNIIIGVVAILHNIISEKNILLMLSDKIKKLSEINKTLINEVNIDDALQIAKQRRQLSLAIQEEIDKKITMLIQQITKFEKDTEQDKKINNLTVLADKLRSILADIRKIVYGR